MPTVLIADDHAFTVAGMAEAIKQIDGYSVVATAHNGVGAIAAAKTHRPDLAMLDLAMPDASGLEVFLEIKRWSPETKVAIVTGNPVAGIVGQLLEAGVHGLFLKSAPVDGILQGIRAIMAGEQVIAPQVAKIIAPSHSGGLSDREIEVLNGIAKGMSNPKIAVHLGISPKTVESHRTSLMKKLEVHSTASLLVRAMRNGLIDV